MAKLKVFCTSSGFHDALVAAPSKAAALKAWGAKTDLFSLGAAKRVTDARLVKKALERPGEVIRLRRTDGAEEPARSRKPSRRARPPSRRKLDGAKKGLAELETRQAGQRDAIEREFRTIEKKRSDLLARHARARAAAELKVEKARQEFEAAMAEWDG